MTHVHRRTIALAALMFGLAAPIHAQTSTAPLDGPTSVPTVTAPAPPPPNVDSRFLGGLSFKDGYPTTETVQRLYDELDFQRGTQVFLRNLPALSMYGLRLGLARDLGVDSVSKFAIFRADANSLMLTPNSETLYGTTFLALDTDGPTIVEAPPSVLGLVNDMWMRPVGDIGAGGPDQGKGGKYLFVPPGYAGILPKTGYFIVRMQTYGGWVFIRALLDPSGNAAPAEALLKQMRIYPLSKKDASPQMTFVEASGKPFDSMPPNDIRYFEMLADLIAREDAHAVDPEVAGMMRAIGIEKGKPFVPDSRLRSILAEAARVGSFMAQAISYAPREPERVRPGSHWMAGIAGYPTFADGRSTLLDEMIYMSWFATGAAKAMGAPKPGTGSQYAWTYYDAAGEWLLGEKSYRFHISPHPPAKDFWSVLAYDNWTRSILANGQKVAGKNSYDTAIQTNADSSIDIYFGPNPPPGKESNWIRTIPGKGWFAMFRLYGPLQPWFDRTWTPDDITATAQ
ncbi:hypothetical protein CWB41_12265 [Methylovirgula ligni]|uniref:DUF1254 domain-containing protein n=1 Tax=Methylovirgula ligni TaxID=569860 RepID=A0A3D9YTQ1_9HYPH|nr:DUF1254 domain-containing protein [Methylovirgula ligni]QAY96410.1 hypothetical protein CWB41_12265 [Methylovirgula ligni]REF85864.1 hypothetical protein DES32_1902 [Methylovirgula ligni]